MELIKNVPINFKIKPIPESIITCLLKTKATKYPIRIDFAIHIYYKKLCDYSGTSILSNVQSIYTFNKDHNHEIKLKTPKFDKCVKSDLLLYLVPGQRCDSVSIGDVKINPTQQPKIPKTQSMVTINITPNLSYEKEEKIKYDKITSENDIKIAITSVVRDEERNGNLIRFLNCCRELELYHSNIVYVFIEGDSSDNTFEILDNWIKERKGSILEKIDKRRAPFPKNKNTIRTIIFAELRNRLIDIVRSKLGAEIILMTDANYEWKGDLINSLMKVGSDISAPMTVKQHKDDKGNYIFYDTWAFRKDGREFRRFYPYTRYMKFDRFVDIDSVGGCYLIKRKVLDAGVRYDGKTDSEHVYFCYQARKMGFSLKINPNIYVKKGIYK